MTFIFLIFIAMILVTLGVFVGGYNSLVQLRNQVKNAWSQVDVQLKRRYDLIPNLVETVKGYMVHERETLEKITEYRSQAMGANGINAKIEAEQKLERVLRQFYIAIENYPDLKANQNFTALHEELTSTENKIAFARQAYNDQVLFLNNKIQMFPSNIIAGMFNFKEETYLRIETAEREVPHVKF
jgi:LemA protein